MAYTQEQLNEMSAEQLKAVIVELQAAAAEPTKVDLSGLTADQLMELSETEWDNFKTTVEAAMEAKAEEEKAKIKAKITTIIEKFKTIDPVIKYVAGAAILLKVFGVI